MKLVEFYEHLKGQAGLLAGAEKQVEDLLDTNKRNLQNADCLKLTTNRLAYFQNQHQVFNVLVEAIGDAKITNSYMLLELESQFREELKTE